MAEDETDPKFFQVVVKVAALLKADGDHGNDYGHGFDGNGVVDDDDDNDDDKNDDNEDDTGENDDSTYTSL